MLKQDDMMAKALQDYETEQTGDVVVSFLAIAEISGIDLGDSTAYRIYSKGSPAMQLGLADYLAEKTRDWLREREDDD